MAVVIPLSDVQNETNGLLAEDREVIKMRGDAVRAVTLPGSIPVMFFAVLQQGRWPPGPA
ncbi:hypothetical protein AB0I93_03755 [Streptomyces sp. NPDC049967]|uniref:hypothetical protein n=1 Tax=Streptomyces sp. NPDC049967 TaxID=3155658 RepID=UPI00342ADFD9